MKSIPLTFNRIIVMWKCPILKITSLQGKNVKAKSCFGAGNIFFFLLYSGKGQINTKGLTFT